MQQAGMRGPGANPAAPIGGQRGLGRVMSDPADQAPAFGQRHGRLPLRSHGVDGYGVSVANVPAETAAGALPAVETIAQAVRGSFQGDGLVAVSYTHLDVYKRQV